jgi:uncharacterized protein (DUF433 family)
MASSTQFPERREGKYRIRDISEYIVSHQGICHGKPTFRGTRVLVHVALASLQAPGQDIETVARDYAVPTAALVDALRLAADWFCNDLRLPNPYGEPDQGPPPETTANSSRHAQNGRKQGAR